MKGMGCEINILRITEYIKIKYEDRQEHRTWILFIDLKLAFDTVNHEILFQKMRDLNIDISLINTIEWLYKQTKIKTQYEIVKIGQSVVQGGVISPSLFLIMFNDLLNDLNDKENHTYAYADDLVVVQKWKLRLFEAIDIIKIELKKQNENQ